MTTTLLLALSLVPARAQEAPALPEAPKIEAPTLPTAPTLTRGEHPVPWRLTVFEDVPGSPDCPPEHALRGQCFEHVRFVTPPGPDDDASARARWKSLAAQEALLWEGLAYRWGRQDDPIQTSIVAAGYDTLPTPASAWETARGPRGNVSAPDPATWLLAGEWLGGRAFTPDAAAGEFFPLVRYRVSTGSRTPAVAVLRGRFASRLGAKGRPHDYDLMDGDPADSAPFFEQLYPFASHAQAGLQRPLVDFELPHLGAELPPEVRARLAPILLEEDGYEAVRRRASAQFADFTSTLSVQVAQFALEDFTPNHMRVFTSLAAMVWPPGPLSERAGGRRLVAAAQGETDAASDIAARVDRSAYILRGGFTLDLESLPADVAATWVQTLYSRHPMGPAEVRDLQAGLADVLGDNLRRDAPPLADPRHEPMTTWAAQAAGYGVDPALVVAEGQRYVLGRLLAAEPPVSRQKFAAEVLLDQLRRAAASVLDGSPGVLTAPNDVVARVSAQWATTLSRHGFLPRPMAQPYGGIDPTAICTTRDGPAALAEPSYGAVDLDLLVRAADRPTGTAGLLPADATVGVLWEARDQLPFLMLDDPHNAPEATRLAGLPGGEALYRVRWRVWTGWHLFWHTEALPSGGQRLAVRSGAICADTVLAPTDLVPTLARAALLVDTYRPTSPVPVKPGQVFDPALEPPPTTHVDYLRSLALAPLRRLADTLGGFLLVAADVDEGGGLVLDLLPPTPYARDVRREPGRDGTPVRTALWARFFGPDAEPAQAPVVYPAFRPGQAVGSDSLHPLWYRTPVADVTFTAGFGAFPWRRTTLTCQDLAGAEGFVAPCASDVAPTSTYTEGLGVDAAALTTFWLLDRPRLGVEAGLEVRLDVNHQGASWVEPDADPSFTWMFRPAGGVLLGLRSAPPPGPLATRGEGLWGVDRVDGSSRLRRVEGGVRAGFLVAPGYLGAEGTLVAEAWGAASARRNRSPLANLTPYDPGALYGLYARVMYATPLLPADTDQRYTLDDSVTVLVGLRGTWDLQVQLPDPPKAP